MIFDEYILECMLVMRNDDQSRNGSKLGDANRKRNSLFSSSKRSLEAGWSVTSIKSQVESLEGDLRFSENDDVIMCSMT